MARLMTLLRFVLIAVSWNIVYGGVNQVPLPTIDLNEWWGPGDPIPNDDTKIYNFTIQFTDAMISDLRSRLQNHRPLTPPLEGAGFDYGFNSDTVELWKQELLTNYNFKERERFFNQYSHYKTKIQGLNIHFMRVTSQNKTNLTPLIILHGHPGSIREFYETIPYLMQFGQANGLNLDIIMPSLPGYTFSDPASKPGLGVDKVSIVMRNLMHRVGYTKYYIQGGDMGGLTTNCFATLFPDEVLGYHTNFPMLHTPDMIFRLFWGNFHQEEIAKPELLSRIYPSITKLLFYILFTGYLHIQATRPDTFGLALSDSPIGLMAHILVTKGTPNNTGTVNATQLLDNWVIYWANNCETTAMRLYSETFNKRYTYLRINEIRSNVPCWVMQTPNELIYLPDWMIRMKYPNLVGETLPPTGGHFYAWQNPKEYAQDVVGAIVAFNKWHAMNSTMYANCSSYITN